MTTPATHFLPDSSETVDPDLDRMVAQFSTLYSFPLDAFQREAISTLLQGDSVMVAAPTGSGKTVVAEFGIFDSFRRTGRVFYTTPIKALSNQKFRDLRAIYGEDVGLLTGDVSENRDARVLVMTTEILRNMLLQSPWEIDDVDTIVFDEIHYLADPERGTTWEESIILCPEHVQLICLSATVTNASEIAGWISRTHRPIRLITHLDRPVPLALYYFHDNDLAMVVDHNGNRVRDFGKVGGELRRQASRQGRGANSERERRAMDEPQPRQIVDALARVNLLPAIYFLFSRNDCQSFAEHLAVMRQDLVTPAQVSQIEAILESYLQSLRAEDRALEQVEVIVRLARKGIGFHHAGLLAVLKQLVEVLFSRGLMMVVFATDTLALGVNMPARTVVVGRMAKYDGRRRRPLIPNEFQQMAGRAGRRGMDAFGHVVMPYSPWIPFQDMLEIATGPLHPVQSAFAVRYNTVLNLWDPPSGDRVRNMLQRSLAQYQTGQRVRLIELDILELEAELAGIVDGRQDELQRLDDSFEEFRSLDRQIQAAQSGLRKLESDLALLDTTLATATPWSEPTRHALKRALRSTLAGELVHLRDHGWAVYLGQGEKGGVGLFLTVEPLAVWLPTEYRQIDYLTDGKRVDLPDAMVEPADPDSLPGLLAGSPELARIISDMNALDLPDLETIAAEFRERERASLEERRAELASRRDLALADVANLERSKREHPFADGKLRKRHQQGLRRRDALEKERNTLAEVLEREIDAEDQRVRNVIRGIRDVLHRFGYLQRGYPTEKADMLADVFDNDGLIICEMVDRGMLEPLHPEELAEVFSWFSFDRDFRYANHFVLPDRLVRLRRQLEDLETDILSEERDLKLFISEGHNPSFYGAALAWSNGSTMVELAEQIELSEGDLVLTFNKTIDLMRQIREMLVDVDREHPLISKFADAERKLRRGIVEQSLSLGFTPISGAPDDALEIVDELSDAELDEAG